LTHLQFKRQTPGSVSLLLSPNQGSNSSRRLDASHPHELLPKRQRKAFIWASNNAAFTLGVIPKALLVPPNLNPNQGFSNRLTSEAFDSWDDRLARGASTGTVAPVIPTKGAHPKRVGMSLQVASTSGFRTHQRVQIRRRFKTALGLLVARGAVGKEVKGRLQLVFDDREAEKPWILDGWTYVLRPSLLLCRMPYPELVNCLRVTLRELFNRATQTEEQW
ncbi:hypothetical protein C8R46DRAFT_822745, partial [Mycena filopes]